MSAGAPDGTFAVKGAKLPDTVFPAVKDVLRYVDEDRTAAALEFLSPIKGPNLPQICVQAGLSLKTPPRVCSRIRQRCRETGEAADASRLVNTEITYRCRTDSAAPVSSGVLNVKISPISLHLHLSPSGQVSSMPCSSSHRRSCRSSTH